MGRADEAQGEGEKKGPVPVSKRARSLSSLLSQTPRRSAGRSPPRPRRITPTGPSFPVPVSPVCRATNLRAPIWPRPPYQDDPDLHPPPHHGSSLSHPPPASEREPCADRGSSPAASPPRPPTSHRTPPHPARSHGPVHGLSSSGLPSRPIRPSPTASHPHRRARPFSSRRLILIHQRCEPLTNLIQARNPPHPHPIRCSLDHSPPSPAALSRRPFRVSFMSAFIHACRPSRVFLFDSI